MCLVLRGRSDVFRLQFPLEVLLNRLRFQALETIILPAYPCNVYLIMA